MYYISEMRLYSWDGVSLKTPRPRGWVGAGRPSGCKSSFNKRNMYQYPHVSQLFILLPWQSRVYPEPLKVVEFVQLTTECCWGQPSDPCQRGCLTSHACVMWGPRTLNADDDDDDDVEFNKNYSYVRFVINSSENYPTSILKRLHSNSNQTGTRDEHCRR